MASSENNITSVTSDNVDPSTIDTTQGGGSGSELQVQVFKLNGYANIDPLSINPGNAPVTEHTALTIPAYYSGCRFISETIGGLPKHVYQRTLNAPKRLDNHPVEWTLNCEPNNLQTPATFWSTFLLHAINWSNGYSAIKVIPNQDPELFIMPPERMTAFRFGGSQWYAFDTEKRADPNDPTSQYLIFSADEMIHLPALSVDGMSGLKMVKLMSGTLRTARNTEAYVSNYFSQGGILGGVVESDKPLTKEQVQEYGDVITNKFSGVDKAHKWIVLGSGAKARTLTPEMDTAQVSENRTFGILDICRMLRVPPHIVYELERATWANIESLGIEVVKYTLNNWITPLEQELTRKLLTRAERKAGIYIRFDVSALLRGDHAAQIDAAVKRTQNGLTTPDEERAVWELPPYEDGIGAEPRVPANTIPLGQTPAIVAPIAPGTPTLPQVATEPPKSPTSPTQDTDGAEDLQAKMPQSEVFALKTHIKLSHFSAMINDAADRVHVKTAKATEAAQKKHADNPQGFTAWANVFCSDQVHFAAAALAPVFSTYSNLSGKPVDGMADRCGQTYGRQLGQHFIALGHKQASTPPDLSKITLQMEGNNDPTQ